MSATYQQPRNGSRTRLADVWQDRLRLERLEEHVLAKVALSTVHPSALQRHRESQIEFQRLEWLGDSVLYYIVSDELLARHTDMDEAKLSRLRTRLTRGMGIAQFARSINFDQIVILGQDTPCDDGVLSDCFEAFLGSIHVHVEHPRALGILRKIVQSMIDAIQDLDYVPAQSPKELLSMWIQAQPGGLAPPRYTVHEQANVNDPARRFRAKVEAGTYEGEGEGPSKQVAEENAAKSIFQPPKHMWSRPPRSISLHDMKNRLQESLSKWGMPSPVIKLLPEPGPCDAPFQVQLEIPGPWNLRVIGYGETRREAENDAHYAVYNEILTLLESTHSQVSSSSTFGRRSGARIHGVDTDEVRSVSTSPHYFDETDEDDTEVVFLTEPLASGHRPITGGSVGQSPGSRPTVLQPRWAASPSQASAQSFQSWTPSTESVGSMEQDSKPYKNKLQELLHKTGGGVTYSPKSQAGPPHAPIFVVEAKSGKDIELGSGRSIKQASEEAAKKLFLKLHHVESNVSDPGSANEWTVKVRANPVGALNELYQKLGKLPTFDVTGPNLDGYFTCSIKDGHSVLSVAKGPSKREAKHAAASNYFRSNPRVMNPV